LLSLADVDGAAVPIQPHQSDVAWLDAEPTPISCVRCETANDSKEGPWLTGACCNEDDFIPVLKFTRVE
jgi:hypothetical protein